MSQQPSVYEHKGAMELTRPSTSCVVQNNRATPPAQNLIHSRPRFRETTDRIRLAENASENAITPAQNVRICGITYKTQSRFFHARHSTPYVKT